VKIEEQIYSCIDLTSLNDSDTESTVMELCKKASHNASHVAAVCIYPKFVSWIKKNIPNRQFKIATVANFPEGTDPIEKVLDSIQQSIADGADEIDVVFPYQQYLKGDHAAARKFVAECKKICGDKILLKVILETGALQEPAIITAAAEDALKSGADFIKTSTGKIKTGATLEAATCMLKVLRELRPLLNREIGFKASGGIRTLEQAVQYVELAESIMGKGWVKPETFRIGASQLVDEG
jgi:deoxyribose-phosphate aldolase